MFVGLTALQVVLAFAYQPFLLVLAAAFGATAYFMWYQATGRMAERMHRRVRFPGARGRSGMGGPSAGARRSDARENYYRARTAGAAGGAATARARRGPTRAEAYRILGLAPGASAQEVKRAYRAKVKEVHPDTDSGDEESFKRVNRAYETLVE